MKRLRLFLLVTVLLALVGAVWGAEIVNPDTIIWIESKGNPLAWNKGEDARGLFQIRPCTLKEWNNYHPSNQYSPNDLWNPIINRKIGEWYLLKRIPSMLKFYKLPVTVENIIISYNAGIKNAIKHRIPKRTKKYLELYYKIERGRK